MIDYNQKDIFGKKPVMSINYNQDQIIRDILYLHGDGNYIDCDPTFSKGVFYKKLPNPKYIFDIEPQTKETIQASCDNLPLENESINILMFDPPFIMGGKNYKEAKEGSCLTGKRFSQFETWKDLELMYYNSLLEFYRVLKIKGILIFKNQDTVLSGRNYFTHCWLWEMSQQIGFKPLDLFILCATNRIIGKMKKQQHARKFHSYFWVLQKQKIK